MSRDLTPRELLAFEDYNVRHGQPSLFEFMKNVQFSYQNGETQPLHSAEEMTHREQYPTLGKLYNRFGTLYDAALQIPGGLAFLKRRDQELAEYIATGNGDKTGYLVKWFEGQLDEGFYYSTRNDELFMSAFLSDARATCKSSLDAQICSAENHADKSTQAPQPPQKEPER